MEVLAHNTEWQGSHGGVTPTLEETESKVAFLEDMATKFEAEGNDPEAIKALETSLFLRRALIQSLARFSAQDPSFPQRQQELAQAAEALVVKNNVAGVKSFKSGDYASGLALLNKGMWLTSGADNVNCFASEEMRLKLRAACLNNLGCLEKKRGDFNRALDYLQGGVALEAQISGVATPATSMNLCAVLNKLGRHAEALDEANSAITNLLAEKHQEGGTNPATNHMLCVAYHNLAMSQEFSLSPMLQRAAEESYAQALSLARAELGPGHPTTMAIQASIERFQQAISRPIRPLPSGRGGTLQPLPPGAMPPQPRAHAAPHAAPPFQPAPLPSAWPGPAADLWGAGQPPPAQQPYAHMPADMLFPGLPRGSVDQQYDLGKGGQLYPRKQSRRGSGRGKSQKAAPKPPSPSRQDRAFQRKMPRQLDQHHVLPEAVAESMPSPSHSPPRSPAHSPPASPGKRASAPGSKTSSPKHPGSFHASSPGHPRSLAASSPGHPHSAASPGHPKARRADRPKVPKAPDGRGRSAGRGRPVKLEDDPLLSPRQRFNSLVPGRPGEARSDHLQRVQHRQVKRRVRELREEQRRQQSKALFERERAKKAVRLKREEQQKKEEMALAMYKKMLAGMRQEELRKFRVAAKKIQKVVKGFMTRRQIWKMELAAIKIQSVVRSHLCRKHQAEEKEREEAMQRYAQLQENVIHAQMWARSWVAVLYRGRRVQALLLRRHCSARKIQTVFRKFLKRMQDHERQLASIVEREQKEKAKIMSKVSLMMQSMWRGRQTRKALQERLRVWRMNARAAVVIQKRWRGVHTRNRLKELNIDAAMQQLQQKAAVLLQAWWRGTMVRLVNPVVKEVARVGAKNQAYQDAAVRIQRAWRVHRAREVLKSLRDHKESRCEAAAIIQCAWRCGVARSVTKELQQARTMWRAACKIQRAWGRFRREREAREMQKYYEEKRAAEALALARTAAAMKIQSWWRGTMTRLSLVEVFAERKKQHANAKEVQRVWRGYYYGRKELARLKRIEALVEKKEQAMRRQWAAAEHIQRWWRRRRFRRLCTIALLWERGSIVIQQHCRGALDTLRAARIRVGREVDRRRRAAVAIQRAWREHRKRVEAAELAAYHGRIQREKALAAAREAATRRIQRIWRGCVARARVHAMQARRHRAAKVIQRWIRQVHFREIILARVEAKFTLHRVQQRAAVRIQKVWRGYKDRIFVAEEAALNRLRQASSLTIQTAWRGKAARLELQRRQAEKQRAVQEELLRNQYEESNLIRVQMHCRAVLSGWFVAKMRQYIHETRHLRHQRAKEEFRHAQATKIQKVYRGYVERFYYRALKREHAELMRQKDFEERRRAQATQRLQNWWRMVMAVGLVKSMRERKQQREAEFARIAEQNQDPADLIANLFWTYEVQTERDLVTEQGLLRAKQSAAATTIQARWRGLATRKHVAARLHLHAATRAASIIQGHWRNYIPKLQKRKAVFKQQKATTIQCAWRQRQARRRVGALRDAARQRKAAGVRAEIRNDKAATACQCFWRTVLAVRRVRYLWLRRKERLEHKRRDRAAADMQRWMRGFLVRKNWGAIKAHQLKLKAALPPVRHDLEYRVDQIQEERRLTAAELEKH